MANPYAQQVRQRKVIYGALILVLLTASLMHRRFVVEPAAQELKLREVAKGEVELTSSAVRLSLTGSRGLAVTFLWSAAIQQQERHEWNELELVIGAVTKLQPYFITPWLFQGWNLAYNVSVECDRPHDKYYYVSRGLNLLAEGERRNHEQSITPGQPGIGQPDLRHFIGIAYQGKFGTADEKTTMRSLLDMSCIDPARRNPDRFWTPGPDGRKSVNLQELATFCRDNPRLVRRLRETLGYTDPRQIIGFLADNKEIPGRFEALRDADQKETPLKKDVRDQFPVLPEPSKRGETPPNASLVDYGLRQENFDLYVVSRAWFEFAQETPVPPPAPDDPIKEQRFDRSKYRSPRAPALAIFRTYPQRAYAYAAEVMEEEGWFDADGWLIRDWFEPLAAGGAGEFRVGTDPKYHAAPAWDRAFRAYKQLGTETGQYLPPEKIAELDQRAKLYRKAFNKAPYDLPSEVLPAEARDPAMEASWRAQLQLAYQALNNRLTNYEAFFHQAEAERTVDQVSARKYFFQAERLRRFENPELAVTLYETAWPLWLSTALRFPKFAEQSTNQDDAYELQLKYLRLMQKQYPGLYRALAAGMAQYAVWPHLPMEELLDSGEKSRILPIRTVGGVLDSARVYTGSEKEELSKFLLAWSQLSGTPRPYLFPGQETWTLVAFDVRDHPLQPGWSHLIGDDTIQSVKQRYNLLAPPAPPPPSAETK